MNEQLYHIIGLFLANFTIIAWFRAESRSDWRHLDAKIDAFQSEMKDFHARLEKQDAEFKAHLLAYHQDKKR